jgi:tetrahydromethanopterin S-methyltransferase subunit F
MLAMVVEYAAAHEHRHVKIGDREVEFIVGWAIEPAYAGVPNKVDLRVLALVEEHEHEHDEHGHAGESRKVPVLGLEKYLKVEVSTGGKSIILNLRPAWGDPGRYFADIVPTVPGVYVFRFFGNVNGTEVNEVFDCSKGHFNCVEPLSKIMFPEVTQPTDELQKALAEIRREHEQVGKRLDQLSVVVDSVAKMHEQMMNTDARLESSINSVSGIAYGGLGAGIISLIVAIVSLIRRPR